jgi:ABC-2 type transport system permease protein
VSGSLFTAIMSKLVGNTVPFGNVLLAGLASIVLVASFGAVAFMVTMLGRGARAASIGVASIVAIGGYVLTSLAGTVEWLKWPSKAFPFYYYRPGEILKSAYHWPDMLYIIALIAVCCVISVIAFRRRDLGGA